MDQILIPLLTAILGLLGGLIVARMQARSSERTEAKRAIAQKRDTLNSLALEIAKLELERAAREGRRTQSSLVAHWAVLRALMEEHGGGGPAPKLPYMVDKINITYGGLCWNDWSKKGFKSQEEMMDALFTDPSLRSRLVAERSMENIRSFLENTPVGLDWTIELKEPGETSRLAEWPRDQDG